MSLAFNHAQWFFPLALTLHNAEEAIWLPGFWQRRQWQAPVSPGQFWAATLALDGLAFLITYLAVKHGERSVPAYLYSGFLSVVLLNVVWHLGVVVWYRAYAPGVVTAVVLNLPLTIYLLRRALRENYIFTSGVRS